MNHNKKVGALVIMLGVMLAGCDTRQNAEVSAKLEEMQEEQKSQIKRLADVEEQQKQIVLNQETIAKALQKIDKKQMSLEYTEFDPTRTRYFILNNVSLALAGKMVSITPTEGGSVVRLSLVNLLSVPVSNIGFHVTWGGAKPANGQEEARWQQLLFSHDMNSDLLLLPGQWQDVNLTLKGISPNNLRYIKMSIDMEKIGLDHEFSPKEGKQKTRDATRK